MLAVRDFLAAGCGAGAEVTRMLEYRSHLGVVEADEGALVGRVAGLRDVVTFEGTTLAEVEQTFRASVDDYLTLCATRGEPPDRPYSGTISLWVDPELHRRAAVHDQAAGVSGSPGDWIGAAGAATCVVRA